MIGYWFWNDVLFGKRSLQMKLSTGMVGYFLLTAMFSFLQIWPAREIRHFQIKRIAGMIGSFLLTDIILLFIIALK